MKMQTCTKTFPDIPFAHRQHVHPGHCAFIHGHNWAFTFEFEGDTDEMDFIVDFGGPFMKQLKADLTNDYDHKCLLNEDDDEGRSLIADYGRLFDVRFVKSCSAEGIARELFSATAAKVSSATNRRVRLIRVTVAEDSKNSASVIDPEHE